MFKYTLDNKRYHTLNYYNKTNAKRCMVFQQKILLHKTFA